MRALSLIALIAASACKPTETVVGSDLAAHDGGASPSCDGAADGASCDDGDPCTVGDACADGACLGGALTACVGQPIAVDRSVGFGQTAPLADGSANTMSLAGTTAVFAASLPDRAGVGDVIEYDSNGDGSPDALALIHRRQSPRAFAVRSAGGGVPLPVTACNGWRLLRAYTRLVDAVEGGPENTGIAPSLQDLDPWTSKDLVATNQSWTLWTYADGVDDAPVYICNAGYPTTGCTGGWLTGPANYLRIRAPRRPTEAGASQRHRGRWGEGYRRTAGIRVFGGFVRLEGLSIKQALDNSNDMVFAVVPPGLPGEVRISDSFGWSSCQVPYQRAFVVFDEGPTGTEPTLVRIWNSVGVNDDPAGGSHAFYVGSALARASFFNCTGLAVSGFAFNTDFPGIATARNCIGMGRGTAGGFGGATWKSISTSVSNDGSALAGTGSFQGTPAFLDEAGRDLHLTPSDTAALGKGANLSADPELAFDDDIDGDTRPGPPAAWDVGADNLVR